MVITQWGPQFTCVTVESTVKFASNCLLVPQCSAAGRGQLEVEIAVFLSAGLQVIFLHVRDLALHAPDFANVTA
jgi:hypothetical protein